MKCSRSKIHKEERSKKKKDPLPASGSGLRFFHTLVGCSVLLGVRTSTQSKKKKKTKKNRLGSSTSVSSAHDIFSERAKKKRKK
jgi:hypothetical protein